MRLERVSLHKSGSARTARPPSSPPRARARDAILPGTADGPVESIEVTPLDDVLAADPPEMIKIDVEG